MLEWIIGIAIFLILLGIIIAYSSLRDLSGKICKYCGKTITKEDSIELPDGSHVHSECAQRVQKVCNEIKRLMKKYLPKCPICKSNTNYEVDIAPDTRYLIECKICGATWLSEDWDENNKKHSLYFYRASRRDGKGITLLGQEHSIKFWQKLDIEAIETPEQREKEKLWRQRKIQELKSSLPSTSEIITDGVFRLFDPVGAIAIRGLPSGKDQILQGVSQILKEMKERDKKRQEIMEKLVLKPECPKCGMEISEDFRICPHCGFKLKPTCPSCGKEISSDFKLCPYCGTKLYET